MFSVFVVPAALFDMFITVAVDFDRVGAERAQRLAKRAVDHVVGYIDTWIDQFTQALAPDALGKVGWQIRSEYVFAPAFGAREALFIANENCILLADELA